MLIPEFVPHSSLTTVRVPLCVQHQSQEFGVNPQDLASMSQAELAMRLGSDQSMYSGWQKSGFKGQSRGKVFLMMEGSALWFGVVVSVLGDSVCELAL